MGRASQWLHSTGERLLPKTDSDKVLPLRFVADGASRSSIMLYCQNVLPESIVAYRIDFSSFACFTHTPFR